MIVGYNNNNSEVCHICGEVLWVEFGFSSENEYLLQQWINSNYNFQYGNVIDNIDEVIEIEDV